MDSASFQFVGFGLAVAILSNFSRKAAWRSGVLFVASLAFLYLLAPQPLTLLPLAGFLAIGYLGVFLLERGVARSYTFSLLVIIFAYIWLKKYTVLPAALFLKAPYFTIGLSYIFFRVLHLLIETADRPGDRRLGPGRYLLYTLNFTTLISGPIQRYEDFAAAQFSEEPAPLDVRVVGLQIERLVRGFFKVNVLAALLDAVHHDALFDMIHPATPAGRISAVLCIVVAYPFYLYCNFSGYIDVVIAIGRLMRLPLPENFDRPFSSSSFLEFWNRWHMTLSNWLKTYVYNPLLIALMRRIPSESMQPFLGVFCFFVTFFLIGVWHGRTSEFIVFGVLQGGGVSVNKLWQLGLARAMGRKGYKALAKKSIYVALGRGLTFSWLAFTLFWFWANWKQIDKIIGALGGVQWLCFWLAIWLGATMVLAAWERLRAALLSIRTAEGPVLTSRYARAVYASTLGLAALVMTVLLNQPAPGVVYKAF
jgi:D-alanyl-lipoteichoic acid acyltransferase DltB (MBOAT superfamily)